MIRIPFFLPFVTCTTSSSPRLTRCNTVWRETPSSHLGCLAAKRLSGHGAKFSECGYATLVGRAERDESLAEKLGLRLDMPGNLLRELLGKVADVVLARFLTAPRPVVREKPRGPGAATAGQNVARPKAIDYTQAQSDTVALNRTGKLNDSMVNRFAVRGEYTHLVAALALKADVKVEAIAPLLDADRMYGLIVACKAACVSWSTTTMIVRNRPGCPPATQRELDQCVAIYEILVAVGGAMDDPVWARIEFLQRRTSGRRTRQCEVELACLAPLCATGQPVGT